MKIKGKKLLVILPLILILGTGLIAILIINHIKSGIKSKNQTPITDSSEKNIIDRPNLAPDRTTTPPLKETRQRPANVDRSKAFCLPVPVLMYHHLEPKPEAEKKGHAKLNVYPSYFEQQVQFLIKHNYQTVSAQNLVNSLLEHKKTPDRSVVLTFDDGYDDIYQNVFPLAKKYKIILNLMIPTGLVGNPGYLTWNNLVEIKKSGLVFIYNHTASHYSLVESDENKILEETVKPQNLLEGNLGAIPKIITYPYGDFNERVIEILKKENFIAGFSTIKGIIECDVDIMNLPRLRIGNRPLTDYGFKE